MTGGCQIDFYVLDSPGKSSGKLACELALKAWEQGFRTVVLTGDPGQAQKLDQLMWEVPEGRFLPHSVDFTDPSAPVGIGTAATVIPPGFEVIINLTDNAIQEPERFKRLLEIVPANENRRKASRQKFQTYRQQGLQPAHIKIGN